MLRAGYTAVCLVGAATEILAVCADTDDYRPRHLLVQRPLAAAVSAMRAPPALRGTAGTITAGGQMTGSPNPPQRHP